MSSTTTTTAATTLLNPSLFCAQPSSFPNHGNKMGLKSFLARKTSSKSPRTNSIPSGSGSGSGSGRRATSPTRLLQTASPYNPFSVPTPTRRPKPVDDAPPPAYTPRDTGAAARSIITTTTNSSSADSPYSFLTQFDTVFLIDDSGSMAGRSWRETSAALAAITPICTAHDADGVDIYFLNHRNPLAANSLGGYTNVTTTSRVDNIFKTVRPLGGTPTGTRLNHILKPYLAQVEHSLERQAQGAEPAVKPLNIIVITDGVPSDDVESVIVQAARKLDTWGAEPWQVGIQFFQVGREPEAAEDLRDLDDALSGEHGIRDIVDTVPWTGDEGQVLTADGLLKVVLGAVNRRLDRRRASDERLRR